MIEVLGPIDRSLFLYLNSFHHVLLDPIMVFLSGKIIWAPVVMMALFFAWRENPQKKLSLFVLFLLLAMVASDVTSSYIFKNIFTRLRPCREEDLFALIYNFGQKCGGRFGFVSSHAANSFTLMAFSLLATKRKSRWWHLLWLVPILVSYSRIYLGVHYPGDILGGAAVGIFWGWLLSWCFLHSKGPV